MYTLKKAGNGCVMYDWKAKRNVGNNMEALDEMVIAECLERCGY